jgi:hypothetical protein
MSHQSKCISHSFGSANVPIGYSLSKQPRIDYEDNCSILNDINTFFDKCRYALTLVSPLSAVTKKYSQL